MKIFKKGYILKFDGKSFKIESTLIGIRCFKIAIIVTRH